MYTSNCIGIMILAFGDNGFQDKFHGEKANILKVTVV